jgi:hypothetical protein
VVLTEGEIMGYTEENFNAEWDRRTVIWIAGSLSRIADALELLVDEKHPYVAKIQDARLREEDILRHIPTFHAQRDLVAAHISENQAMHPKDILEKLVALGLYSKSTYWKDVKVLAFLAAKYQWDQRRKNG